MTIIQEMRQVYDAILYLDSRCDGAHDEDGMGFNGTDTGTGKRVACMFRRGDLLKPEQWIGACALLQKYRKSQLEPAGLTIPNWGIAHQDPEPSLPEVWTHDPSVVWVWNEGNRLICAITMPDQYWSRHLKSYSFACKQSGLAYNGDKKRWVGPLAQCHDALVTALTNFPLRVEWRAARPGESLNLAKTFPELHPSSPIWEKGGLKPYQLEAIALLRQGRNWLLGDEMGLGKTVTILLSLPLEAPALIFAPKAARAVWSREISLHCPRPVVEIEKVKDFRPPQPGEIIVTNYEKLTMLSDEFLGQLHPGTYLVADECHLLQGKAKGNSKVQRVVRFRELMRAAKQNQGVTIGATGTPVLNDARGMYRTLTSLGLEKIAFPGCDGVNSYREFSLMCGVDAGMYGRVDPLVKTERLPRVMIRRTRQEVFPQMPPKQYEFLEVEISAGLQQELNEILGRYGLDPEDPEFLSALNRTISFEEFTRIRSTVAQAKIPSLLALVQDLEEAGEPVVVCSSFLPPIKVLDQREGWRVIHGETSADQRGEIQDLFQAGQLKGVALTIRAGGVGITLSHACRMVINDLDLTVGMNKQAEDRLRPHLQQRSCLYTTLVANHPMDRNIQKILRTKTTLLEQLHS